MRGQTAREFEFTDRDFERIRKLVKDETGIALSESKRDMVYGRLAKRLRHLELRTFEEYCRAVVDGGSEELVNLVNAITTNLTFFFRQPEHFEFLEKTLLPQLAGVRSRSRRIRLWSAGCSTGEEPYSAAIVARELFDPRRGWDVRILATDLDTNVLERAMEGVYAEEQLRLMTPRRRSRWFRPTSRNGKPVFAVDPELRDMITFRQLNLMHGWPMRGPLDAIFCRNVVIYFDMPTQRVLFERFADLLADEGNLFVGYSESLFRITRAFDFVERGIYRRV